MGTTTHEGMPEGAVDAKDVAIATELAMELVESCSPALLNLLRMYRPEIAYLATIHTATTIVAFTLKAIANGPTRKALSEEAIEDFTLALREFADGAAVAVTPTSPSAGGLG